MNKYYIIYEPAQDMKDMGVRPMVLAYYDNLSDAYNHLKRAENTGLITKGTLKLKVTMEG